MSIGGLAADDDRTVVAGEYVLGTLPPDEHRAVEARLAVDPGLRAEVFAWQDRLLGLSRLAAPVAASSGLWPRIEAALGAVGVGGSTTVGTGAQGAMDDATDRSAPDAGPGAVAGARPGARPGAPPGTAADALSDVAADARPGTGLGAGLGGGLGAGPGAVPGAVPGAAPGVEPGAMPGAGIGAAPGAKPGTKPAVPAGAREPWWQRLGFWQGLSAAGALATLVLAVLLAGRPTPTAEGTRYLAVLQAPAGAPNASGAGWVVEAGLGRDLRLVPIGAADAVPAGRSLQFWTKAERATAPTSLGLVRAGEALTVRAAALPALEARQLFEITLEPEGGSTVGRPTGPILYLGRTVAL